MFAQVLVAALLVAFVQADQCTDAINQHRNSMQKELETKVQHPVVSIIGILYDNGNVNAANVADKGLKSSEETFNKLTTAANEGKYDDLKAALLQVEVNVRALQEAIGNLDSLSHKERKDIDEHFQIIANGQGDVTNAWAPIKTACEA